MVELFECFVNLEIFNVKFDCQFIEYFVESNTSECFSIKTRHELVQVHLSSALWVSNFAQDTLVLEWKWQVKALHQFFKQFDFDYIHYLSYILTQIFYKLLKKLKCIILNW